ncbi:hypothetical protein BK138_19380 [Paenibacillus rhizosphaerae]|uniref:Uncharacterized protein n=2 Tax=Paenibacillus TaxID=44249 RepID=A0A1R1EMM9_9BACL|nr:hypothetical protein [Paenibacillus rhizosphaerae]OMF53076.1 hypothetical protein BK138_19380 [Paenibacillus rhizosphaerae]
MNKPLKQQELISYIAEETQADRDSITLVLKYEEAYINNAKADVKGEVEIDMDDLVDYVLSRRDIKLDEMTVEAILEAEMDFLMDQGLASYED